MNDRMEEGKKIIYVMFYTFTFRLNDMLCTKIIKYRLKCSILLF